MNVLSLFDGISCGMVALERAGFNVDQYYAYEIDDKAIKVSKKNYPMIEHKGNVFNEDFSQYEGKIDLLLGGSPCVYWSITKAGNLNTSKPREVIAKGKGWELFFQYKRALDEAKPKWFLYENVASMSDVVRDAISECLGVQPVMIDSKYFSAQHRERYYWTNFPVDTDIENRFVSELLVLNDILETEVNEKFFYNCGYDFHGEDKSVAATVHVNGHDILKRASSRYFKSPTLTTISGGNTQKKVYVDGRCRKLTPIEYERLQTLPDDYTKGISNTARWSTVGNGWTVDVIVHLLKYISTPK